MGGSVSISFFVFDCMVVDLSSFGAEVLAGAACVGHGECACEDISDSTVAAIIDADSCISFPE